MPSVMFASDDEIFALVISAAKHDMGVRIVSIPVVHRDPIKLCHQIRLHSRHELAGEGTQIVDVNAVLGRDDEAELVSVLAPFRGEVVPVGGVASARF
jgi:hypothetical protein